MPDTTLFFSLGSVDDCVRIRAGFGACLQASVFQPAGMVAEGDEEGSEYV